MTRAWLLMLCLIGAGAGMARADAPAADENAGWRTVTLFDWLYSGEPAYQVLKQAATASGDQGWVAQRMAQNQKVPQASARELAEKLEENQTLDPALHSRLKTMFADETQQVGQSSQDAVAKQADKLDQTLSEASAKLDELEASLKRNTYGKGSSTGVTLLLYEGYRLDDPSGMVQGLEHGYTAGGTEVLMNGSIGQVNYNISMGIEYDYNNLNAGSIGTLGMDVETDRETLDAGVTLQFPIGNNYGLDVSLGAIQNFALSPLLFAGIFPVNRDAFFVDVTQDYRAPKVVKTMEINYPASTYNFRGLNVITGFRAWYWPFDSTQFVYTPDSQTYYYSWDPKIETWAMRMDENLIPRGEWFDGGNVYGMLQGSSNDLDQMIGDGAFGGLTGSQPTTSGSGVNPQLFQQRTFSYGFGALLRSSTGAILHLDGAVSSYDWAWPNDVSQSYNGTAFIATLAQPVGPFNFAVEAGQASPYFLSSPRVENRIQIGATQDSIADVYNANGDVDIASEDLTPAPTKPAPVSWISMMNLPDVLTNNNNQLSLKGEWHGSWISAGLYDGAQMQINPTEAYVWTTPYIEGNQNDGYGWFRMFGNTFPSGAEVAPGASEAGAATGTIQQINFNTPTDATAVFPGSSPRVHWQQMAQYGNYETEFISLLSQKGVGDDHVMANSAKSLNYAGTNLLFDFGSLLDLTLPLQLTIIGEDRDLSAMPGAPTLGGSNSLFNQQFEVANLNWGVSDTVTLLGMAGFETWKTLQSYYPLNMQITEFGVGADLDADPFVTGLAFNLRVSDMHFQDLNIASRDLSFLSLSVGSTLSY